MTKYFLRITGLALLWSVPFLGQALADDATCCGNAGCESCCNCCPQCGCKLVPVCHIECTTKKVITYKYTCNCEDICVPGVTRCCDKHGNCDGSGECAATGDTCNNGCQEGCGGRCTIHEVHKLVKCPVTTEVPVRKCTVEWVCPHCNCQGNCAEGAAPAATVPPSAPMPPAAAPAG